MAGYTQLAHEILETIAKTTLNGTQFRILIAIWRATYGYHKTKHDISISFLSNATDIPYNQIQRELKKLIEFKIIKVDKNYSATTSKVLMFNESYHEWVTTKKGSPLISGEGSPLISGKGHHEKEVKKRYINKNIKILADENFEKLWSLYPRRMNKGKVTDEQKQKILKIPYDEMVRAINRYKDKLKKDNTPEQFTQIGYTFFTTGYLDYLDCEYGKPLPKNVTPFKPNFIEKEFGQ